ncbi:MAG: hypothetical protein P8L46_13065 [Acidimicrobiales bacterium]|nr:hypothetical protein [Acidimicrobiales bacterium]MDG2218964.1 hypothetical protein [Acidimicrobiales bacterium]
MRRIGAMLSVLLAILVSCALPSDETAVRIDPEALGDNLRTDVASTTTTSMRPTPLTATLEYFLIGSQGERQVVVAVERDVDQNASLFTRLAVLFGEGIPTNKEAERSWFNPATEFTLTAASRDGTIIIIDIIATNEDGSIADPLDIDADILRDTAAQLVYTTSRFDEISSVRLLYDGENIPVPTQTEEGDSDGLLRISDYQNYDPDIEITTTTAPATTTLVPEEPSE